MNGWVGRRFAHWSSGWSSTSDADLFCHRGTFLSCMGREQSRQFIKNSAGNHRWQAGRFRALLVGSWRPPDHSRDWERATTAAALWARHRFRHTACCSPWGLLVGRGLMDGLVTPTRAAPGDKLIIDPIGRACQRRRKWVRRQVPGTFSLRTATYSSDKSPARRATAPGTYAGSAWL